MNLQHLGCWNHLEKLAGMLLNSIHREHILLILKIKKLLRKIKSKNLTAQCSHSRRIARNSLGNCKNHAHFLGPKREFTHVFSLKMYRKSSLFIHSTASLISFILFGYLMLF